MPENQNPINLADTIIDFITNVNKVDPISGSKYIPLDENAMVEDLLSEIEVSNKSFANKVPIYIIPEKMFIDIKGINVRKGKLGGYTATINLILTINPNEVTATMLKLDNVQPIELAGVIDPELLEVAFGLFLEDLNVKKQERQELLQQTGFGSF